MSLRASKSVRCWMRAPISPGSPTPTPLRVNASSSAAVKAGRRVRNVQPPSLVQLVPTMKRPVALFLLTPSVALISLTCTLFELTQNLPQSANSFANRSPLARTSPTTSTPVSSSPRATLMKTATLASVDQPLPASRSAKRPIQATTS